MFLEPTQISRNGVAVYGADEGLFVEFDYGDPVQDMEQTALQGRPIFKDVIIVRIIVPGDNTTERVRPVIYESTPNQRSDLERFPRQWEAFQRQAPQTCDGTPLEQWPMVNKAQIRELKAQNIHTVEHLAAVADVNLKWMGARTLRDNAKVWLEEAEAGAGVARVQHENQQLKNELESLKAMIADMQKNMASPIAYTAPVLEQVQATVLVSALDETTVQPMQSKMRGRPKKEAE